MSDGYSSQLESCADGVISHTFTTNDCTGTFEVHTTQFPSTSGECFDLYEAQCYQMADYLANSFESDYLTTRMPDGGARSRAAY